MDTGRLKVLYLPKPDHTELAFTPYWWSGTMLCPVLLRTWRSGSVTLTCW